MRTTSGRSATATFKCRRSGRMSLTARSLCRQHLSVVDRSRWFRPRQQAHSRAVDDDVLTYPIREDVAEHNPANALGQKRLECRPQAAALQPQPRVAEDDLLQKRAGTGHEHDRVV